jgi:hypothetical protein
MRVTNPVTKENLKDPAVIAGFLIPILVAVAIGLLIRIHSKPIAAPVEQQTNASGAVTSTAPVNPPTAAEVASANQTILNYCSSDLRQDTSCALIANSTVAAPGFVETGVKLSGSFASDGATPDGLALAKGSGTSWSVIWVGQTCIPKDVASQNNVPTTLTICTS